MINRNCIESACDVAINLFWSRFSPVWFVRGVISATGRPLGPASPDGPTRKTLHWWQRWDRRQSKPRRNQSDQWRGAWSGPRRQFTYHPGQGQLRKSLRKSERSLRREPQENPSALGWTFPVTGALVGRRMRRGWKLCCGLGLPVTNGRDCLRGPRVKRGKHRASAVRGSALVDAERLSR